MATLMSKRKRDKWWNNSREDRQRTEQENHENVVMAKVRFDSSNKPNGSIWKAAYESEKKLMVGGTTLEHSYQRGQTNLWKHLKISTKKQEMYIQNVI